MTITEILNEIKEQRIELEIYQVLQQWIIDDRAAWIDRCMDAESTIRCIGKIAYGNSNKAEALEGIKNICFDEYNKAIDKQQGK